MERDNSIKRGDIQTLRALALILVLFYHLEIPGFKNGFLGVDVFLVISGYLIASVQNKYSTLSFYKARLLRLLPAYILTITATTILVLLITVPSDAIQRFDNIPSDLFFLSNIAYWADNSYFDYASFKPLLNTWSLGLEVQFYLIFPLLVYVVKDNKFCWLAIFLVSLLICFVMMSISPKTSFFLLPFRLWEFLVGVLVFYNPINLKSVKAKDYLLILCFIALFSIIFLLPIKIDIKNILYGHPSVLTFLLVIIIGSIISLGYNEKSFLNSAFGSVFIRLGNASYSIYLVHFPMIILWNYEPFSGTQMGLPLGIQMVFFVIILFCVSMLLYTFVERQKHIYIISSIVVACFLLLSCLSLFGESISYTRYSIAQEQIFKATLDRDKYRCGKIFRLINPMAKICPISHIDSRSKVLLLGDSHADSIKKVFSEVLEQAGVKTYFAVDNSPLASFRTGETSKLMLEIKELEIDGIVLHFSDHHYSYENLAKLISFVEIMGSKGVMTALILPVPTYSDSIPEYLYMRLGAGQLTSPRPEDPRLDLLSERTKALWRAAHEADVQLYDPRQFLCPEDSCTVWDGDKPYYFDNNHLTITGSLLLLPLFEDIVKFVSVLEHPS